MIPINDSLVSTGFAEVLYSLNPCTLVIFGVRGLMDDMLLYFPAPDTPELTCFRHHSTYFDIAVALAVELWRTASHMYMIP